MIINTNKSINILPWLHVIFHCKVNVSFNGIESWLTVHCFNDTLARGHASSAERLLYTRRPKNNKKLKVDKGLIRPLGRRPHKDVDAPPQSIIGPRGQGSVHTPIWILILVICTFMESILMQWQWCCLQYQTVTVIKNCKLHVHELVLWNLKCLNITYRRALPAATSARSMSGGPPEKLECFIDGKKVRRDQNECFSIYKIRIRKLDMCKFSGLVS